MLHKKIVVIDEHINLTDTDGFKRMKSLSPISTNLSDSKQSSYSIIRLQLGYNP